MISNQQQKDLKKRAAFKKLNVAMNSYVELLFLSVPLIHIFKWLESLALHLIH
ncbi:MULTISPECIES: hypothetical protein [Bacillus]|uniref:hypothetical protein n=1 Tax=Bacillus TaxID=1386 RepID=UPI0004A4F353|nr:hypothetical protein [Bacillus subtilis]AIX06392.1 hypothetical protein OB04_00706 [Bacillus subtilis]MDX6158128.1 hypothetical protein [Bacillus subtilis]MEC1005861.1 hypothetical protein [Bacillus subtilis]MEC1074916.1 hypothetical protein [Bacillus subtilis]PRS91073.1 hypothetical protein C6349_15775 [Bacillus subtilis subsp. subtilis]